MSLNEPLALKHTNVSQPRLSNSNSKQSLAASEDYYSLKETSSSESGDERSLQTAIRYTTPPSRLQSSDEHNALLQPISPSSPVNPPRSRTQESLTIPPSVRFEQQHQVRRKPVGSPSSFEQKRTRSMDPTRSPVTTPGVDDTPYIRFAIEQLTRDEDVRGTRIYAPLPSPHDSLAHPQAPPQQELSEAKSFPVETGIHDEGLGYMDMEKQKQRAAPVGPKLPPPAAVPFNHPGRSSPRQNPNPPPALREPPPSPDVFVPFRAPIDSPVYSPLRFLPGILRPVWLGLYMFLVLLMLVGLMYCAIRSGTHSGLRPYRAFGDGRYFVFEFLPVMLGMVLLLWLFEIEGAVTRIAPFLGLSSHSTRARSNAAFLDLHPTQFLAPRTEYFRSGQPLIGSCFMAFWVFLFTIPLLASSFNVQFFGSASNGQWHWVAVQGVIWTCILLYIVLLIALSALGIYLWRATTGLKWDPRSIADIVSLLERSNIMSDYAGTETFYKTLEFRQRLWNRTDRLGYWNTTRRPMDIFYGIGEEGGATRVYSIEAGRIKEKPSHGTATSKRPNSNNGAGGVYSIRSDIRSPRTRRRHLPWFLRDSALVAWTLLAIILYIAFLIVSFVNDALHKGFSPALRAGSNSAGFSSANFLYSFIPTLIATLLFLMWQPIDLAYRRLEPFAQLSDPSGATAEHSLLLDYPACAPVAATLKALANRHWSVAFVSGMTLLSTTLPVLAAGLFWAQFYPSDATVRMAAWPPALFALCVFLALYALAFAALSRGRGRRALPHDARSLAHLVSWLYMSRLLGDRAFARCATKAELVARLVGSGNGNGNGIDAARPWRRDGFVASVTNLVRGNGAAAGGRTNGGAVLTEKSAKDRAAVHRVHVPGQVRYGFGVYVGRDGREHLGVDRVKREGQTEMVLFDDAKGRKRRSLLT